MEEKKLKGRAMFQYHSFYIMGFPGGSVVKNPPVDAGKDPLEKEMATRSLPEESHGQRSLEGYNLWDHKS